MNAIREVYQPAHERPKDEQFALSWRDGFCAFLRERKGYASETAVKHWGLRQRPPLSGELLENVLTHFLAWNEVVCCARGSLDYYHLPGLPPPRVVAAEESDEGEETSPSLDVEPMLTGAASNEVTLRPIDDADDRRLPVPTLSGAPDLRQASGLMFASLSPDALLAWAKQAADVKRQELQLEAARLRLDDLLTGRIKPEPEPIASPAKAKPKAKKEPAGAEAATAEATAATGAPAEKAAESPAKKPSKKGKTEPNKADLTILDVVRAGNGKPVGRSYIESKTNMPEVECASRTSWLIKHGFLALKDKGYVLGKAAS